MALPAQSWEPCRLCGVPHHFTFLKDGLCSDCEGLMPPPEEEVPPLGDDELNYILGTDGGSDDSDSNHLI